VNFSTTPVTLVLEDPNGQLTTYRYLNGGTDGTYEVGTNSVRCAVCTTAAVVGNSGSNFQDWLDESSRGTSPQPACPSVLTI
jgi:hypothetical protein